MAEEDRVELPHLGYDDDGQAATKGDIRALHRRLDRFEENIANTLFGRDKMSGLAGEVKKLKFQAALVKWFAAGLTLMGITAFSSAAARWVDKVNKIIP